MPSRLDAIQAVLAEYQITKYGFLPAEEPLQYLDDPYYQPWESIINELPELLSSGHLRQAVDRMPVLDTTRLVSEEQKRRAYVIFSFLTHAYIWGGATPSERLPPCISIPFLAVSQSLGLPPTATYAGLNLWNWSRLSPSSRIILPEQLTTLHTLTGTQSERWFFLISVSMEALCAPTIPVLLTAISAASQGDSETVVRCLEELTACLKRLGPLFERMYEQCDPHVFYHRIRPFLAGSKNMAKAGLPNGVFYDEDNGKGEWRMYSGGSNAQSSIIQFFDIVLCVTHHPTRGQIDMEEAQKGEHNFIKDMRSYMPGPHRRFLEYVSSIANIRPYVRARPNESRLVEAYNDALTAMRIFRDKHIKLVSRYIVAQSRMVEPKMSTEKVNLATASKKAETGELYGTGGTTLMAFLKQARDETDQAKAQLVQVNAA